MPNLKDLAIVLSAQLGLPYLFRVAPGQGVTTLLFHQFRFNNESLHDARERLRRQLDFLVSNFDMVDIETALRKVDGEAETTRTPMLITLDDAKRDILDVFDIFERFEVPILQFVCAGWTARVTRSVDTGSLKPRLISWLHFYDGPEDLVHFGKQCFRLDHSGNSKLIDAVIATTRENLLGALAEREAANRHKRSEITICNWSELRDLQKRGMTIGCHSVSHPHLAQQSSRRQQYEIAESRQLIESYLGHCPYFAYPFGTPSSHDKKTYKLLKEQKFLAAFTTWPDIAREGHDKLLMPRIALPDVAMTHATFQARARGGGIPLSRLKNRHS